MKTGQQLVYTLFLGLLVTTFVVSHPIRALADEFAKLAASPAEIKPLQAGERAPRFVVRTVDDEPYVFDPDKLQRPTVLISFRGGWCPYCNMHLSELRTAVPEIRAMGFDVLFLSGDRPDMLYDSLKRETRDDIAGLDYTILSDASIEAAIALGTAFRAADSTIARRHENGEDIRGSSLDGFHALTVPAVYVIEKSGDIGFAFAEPDYKVRLSAEELLAVAQKYRN